MLFITYLAWEEGGTVWLLFVKLISALLKTGSKTFYHHLVLVLLILENIFGREGHIKGVLVQIKSILGFLGEYKRISSTNNQT